MSKRNSFARDAGGAHKRLMTHAYRLHEYSPEVIEAWHKACDDISRMLYQERQARAVQRQGAGK